MLRIFGVYQSSGRANSSIGRSIVEKMIFSSHAKNKFTEVKSFEFGNVYLAYELLRSDESSQYFFISKNKKQACFVIGNIFAYEENDLEVLSGQNLAKFVLEKYKERGLGFLQYLRGEFNVILIDEKNLFLINDQMGLSPMYIYRVDEGIVFCSEAEPIIWLGKKNRLDCTSIAEFFIYGFIPDGKTFVENLYNQFPATVVTVNNKKCVQEKYSSFKHFTKLNSLSLKEKAGFVNKLFLEAIKIRIPANEPIVQELTGGWDTRFILAAFLSFGKSPLAITACNTSRNDLLLAQHVAKKFGVRHCVVPDTRSHVDRAFIYKFRLSKNSFFTHSKNMSLLSENISDVKLQKFLLAKKFSGLCGTEIVGLMPDTFFRVFQKDFFTEAKLIFTDFFLSTIKAGLIFLSFHKLIFMKLSA